MKITDHKLSEGIALTFRVPEGNIKHPLIILCHGFCGIRNVLLLALRMPSQKQDSQRLLLIIEDSVRVMENEGVWFLQCRPKILFQLSIGQKSRNVLIISVLGYGEHRWEGACLQCSCAGPTRKCIVSQLAFADGDVLVTGEMNESERASFLSTLNKMAEKKKTPGKRCLWGLPGY